MAAPTAGREYAELSNPVPVSVPGKIEVVEVFWYGCPHSYSFERAVAPWADKLANDVMFRKVPAMDGGPWDAHGQMFLTLEAMGAEDKVHASVFDAVHHKNMRLTKHEEQADYLASQGIDKDKYLGFFNSFAIQGKVKQTKDLAKRYEITGTPSMVVNGKYRFDLGTAGGPQGALNVADHLIAKERTAQG